MSVEVRIPKEITEYQEKIMDELNKKREVIAQNRKKYVITI